MKNNKKIINSANRTLARELSSIKNLKSTFNENFCKAVNLIYNTKGKVVIGSTGFVDGSLSCNSADIEGQVKGKIIVTDTLSLRSSANVNGDVQIGKLAVEPGAIFNAQCQMKNAVKDNRVKFIIGDVRDDERVLYLNPWEFHMFWEGG